MMLAKEWIKGEQFPKTRTIVILACRYGRHIYMPCNWVVGGNCGMDTKKCNAAVVGTRQAKPSDEEPKVD